MWKGRRPERGGWARPRRCEAVGVRQLVLQIGRGGSNCLTISAARGTISACRSLPPPATTPRAAICSRVYFSDRGLAMRDDVWGGANFHTHHFAMSVHATT